MKVHSEFPIFANCKLIGLTIAEIEEKYKVIVDHFHNPELATKSRKPFNPGDKIRPYIYINVCGPAKNIGCLYREAFK